MRSTAMSVLVATALLLCCHQATARTYKFAMFPKLTPHSFFDIVDEGCHSAARSLSKQYGDDVKCVSLGPAGYDETGLLQVNYLEQALADDSIDGIAISVLKWDAIAGIVDNFKAKKIPVITYDSDAPSVEDRISYIGTDNSFFGERLAKTLKQLKPDGGTYAICSADVPNIRDREKGVRDELAAEKDFPWTEEPFHSPMLADFNNTIFIEQVRAMASNTTAGISAIIPLFGGMMVEKELWENLIEDFPHITFVVADDSDYQLKHLARNKVHGLVGQMPYDMGQKSIETLYKIVALDQLDQIPPNQGTNVLEHLQIPLELPKLTVDRNELGWLKPLGWFMFCLTAIVSIGAMTWTLMHWKVRVVRVAQPEFLLMVAVGALIMGSSIIPLSFDDSGDNFNTLRGEVICMGTPWLLSLGFTITFSALFAKTWRVNRLFGTRNTSAFQRVTVRAQDVIAPFVVLFTGNIVTLICWTVIDPLLFVRKDSDGLDPWGRVIATYGICESEGNATPYLGILVCLNVSILLLSNYQAYQARALQDEFSETKYIAMVVGSMLQIAVLGVPILLVVQNYPVARFLALSIMIFVLTMVVISAIFIPKIYFCHHFVRQSEQSQNEFITNSLRNSKSAQSSNFIYNIQTSNRFESSGQFDEITTSNGTGTVRKSGTAQPHVAKSDLSSSRGRFAAKPLPSDNPDDSFAETKPETPALSRITESQNEDPTSSNEGSKLENSGNEDVKHSVPQTPSEGKQSELEKVVEEEE